jgi:hypothetical protein
METETENPKKVDSEVAAKINRRLSNIAVEQWDALSIGSCPDSKMTDVSAVECVYSCAGWCLPMTGGPDPTGPKTRRTREDRVRAALDEDRNSDGTATKQINARQADRREDDHD